MLTEATGPAGDPARFPGNAPVAFSPLAGASCGGRGDPEPVPGQDALERRISRPAAWGMGWPVVWWVPWRPFALSTLQHLLSLGVVLSGFTDFLIRRSTPACNPIPARYTRAERGFIQIGPRSGTTAMTRGEIECRCEQLVAELDCIDTQLDDLADLRTWPGPLDPAELECQLLRRMSKKEYELDSVYFEMIGGKMPSQWAR